MTASAFTAPAAVWALAQVDRIPADWLDADALASVIAACERTERAHVIRARADALAGRLALAVETGADFADLTAAASDTLTGRAILETLTEPPAPDLDRATQGRIGERIAARRASLPLDVPQTAAARETHAWRVSALPHRRTEHGAPGTTAAERELDERRDVIRAELAAHREVWASLSTRATTGLDALEHLVSLLQTDEYLVERVRAYVADVAEADALRARLGLTWTPGAVVGFTTA
jgi:hypothetical protein